MNFSEQIVSGPFLRCPECRHTMTEPELIGNPADVEIPDDHLACKDGDEDIYYGNIEVSSC